MNQNQKYQFVFLQLTSSYFSIQSTFNICELYYIFSNNTNIIEKMQPQPQQQKQKQVPQNLRLKLNTLIKSIKSGKYTGNGSAENMNGKIQWIDNNTIAISQSPFVVAHIGSLFDMSFKTFIKFVEIVGCKVSKIDSQKYNGIQSDVYSITIPEQPQQQESTILKLLLQQPPSSQPPKQSLYETSIQANMQQQSELYSIEYENQLKDLFVKKFKINIEETNQFIYQTLYKILINKKDKKISPCQIMELLTQVRDRVFQNQKQVQECIGNFREKIRSFGDAKPDGHNGDGKNQNKMVNQQEQNVGFQPINFGSKNNL